MTWKLDAMIAEDHNLNKPESKENATTEDTDLRGLLRQEIRHSSRQPRAFLAKFSKQRLKKYCAAREDFATNAKKTLGDLCVNFAAFAFCFF